MYGYYIIWLSINNSYIILLWYHLTIFSLLFTLSQRIYWAFHIWTVHLRVERWTLVYKKRRDYIFSRLYIIIILFLTLKSVGTCLIINHNTMLSKLNRCLGTVNTQAGSSNSTQYVYQIMSTWYFIRQRRMPCVITMTILLYLFICWIPAICGSKRIIFTFFIVGLISFLW